eukprot:TRINITY_DN14654_c0_g1_i1.p1 TRINITY_DN14654_c0_g1~~TRINITY_DN14654_c0_g1_i1.p1  ORF type:complete len:111 (+),score=5.21 TRINITY_DN14654_c0_g1_i1:219-551(+)
MTDGLAHVASVFDAHFAVGSKSFWLAADDGEPIGVAYCNPEPLTSGTWNLLMLWVRDDRQSRGVGRALITETESRLRHINARLLIAARAFYTKSGFTHDKLVFTKPIGES